MVAETLNYVRPMFLFYNTLKTSHFLILSGSIEKNIDLIRVRFILVHGIGAKLVSNWEQNMLCTKSWQILCKKRICILAGLKVSYLGCKCVFYRPKHKAVGRPHGNEFWRSWNAEMKYANGYNSKSRWEKWGNLSSYRVHSQSYGH